MKILPKHTVKTALAALLLSLVSNALGADLSLSVTTTQDELLADSTEWSLVSFPADSSEFSALTPSTSVSGNTITMEDESSSVTPALGLSVVAGGSLTSQDISDNTVNITNTAYNKTIYGALLAGNAQNYLTGSVFNNSITVTSASVASVRAAQTRYLEHGDAYGNTLTLNSSTATTAFGAYHKAATGDARENGLVLNASTITSSAYAAYYTDSTGAVSNNYVTASSGSYSTIGATYVYNSEATVLGNTVTAKDITATSVYGAYLRDSSSGEVQGNAVNLEDSTVKNAIATYLYRVNCEGQVTGNSVTISQASSATGEVAAVHLIGTCIGNIDNNTVTVDGGSSVDEALAVYAKLTTGSNANITSNEVSITNCSTMTGDTYGVYLNGSASSSSTISDNAITIDSSTVKGSVYGAYINSVTSDVSGNTITLDSSTVMGNVYGAYIKSGSSNVTGNTVILKGSGGDLSAATIYGGASSGNAATISNNTLKTENYSGTVAGVSAFDTIEQNGGSVTVTNGAVEAGKKLVINGESADSPASLSAGADTALSVSGGESVVVKNAVLTSDKEVTVSGSGSIDLEDSFLSGSDVTISGGTTMRLHNITILVSQGGTADLRNTTISGNTSVSVASAYTLTTDSDEAVTVLLDGSTVVLDETNSTLIGEDGNYTINASQLFSGLEVAGSFTLDLSAYSEMLTDFTTIDVDFEETVVLPDSGNDITVALNGQRYSTTADSDGESVSFTRTDAIPEPSTATLSLLALAALAARRRRK